MYPAIINACVTLSYKVAYFTPQYSKYSVFVGVRRIFPHRDDPLGLGMIFRLCAHTCVCVCVSSRQFMKG